MTRGARDQQILDALEAQLATAPLRELGVEQIAAAAGITRTRFYHYYKSKGEAYAALLQRISTEVLDVYHRPDSWWASRAELRPRETLMRTLRDVLTVWVEHGVVLREASDMWNASPEVRAHWHRVIDSLVDGTRATIEHERARGLAPPGADALLLARSLIWQGERLLFLKLIGAPGAMTITELVDLGAGIWMRTVYLCDDPSPS
jgi:AcrR family transcriptional regulator